MRYNPSTDRFDRLWEDVETQVSGVPAISGGSNLVYGTGAEEETRRTCFYGFRLKDDAHGKAGERVIRFPIGDAPFRETTKDRRGNVVFKMGDYRLTGDELFDAGNNLVILEDRSIIMVGGRALVRIRDAR